MRSESRLLASAMRRQFRHAPRRRFRAWSDPATNVLDCVLSLNRQYNAFVKPRLETFSTRHPKMMGLSSLRHLIRRYKSPGAFSVDELDYNHPARARVLLRVTEFLILAQKGHSGKTE